MNICAAPGKAVAMMVCRAFLAPAGQSAGHSSNAAPCAHPPCTLPQAQCINASPTASTTALARSFLATSFMCRCVLRRKRCRRSRPEIWTFAQKLRSFSLPFTGAAGAWLCGSFVFSSIKRGCSFLTFWVESYKFISIIHSARADTRLVTKFGQSFHRGFTVFSYFSIQQCPHILGQGALHSNGAGVFLHRRFQPDAAGTSV